MYNQIKKINIFLSLLFSRVTLTCLKKKYFYGLSLVKIKKNYAFISFVSSHLTKENCCVSTCNDVTIQ